MATYVTSDLHGLSLPRFLALLNKANFSESDTLYVLGDVIDREGDGGVAVLEWLSLQENAVLLLGNHEEVLLACEFAFDEITEEGANALTGEMLETLMTYSREGGDVTLSALRRLAARDPALVHGLFDYLRDAPLYETVHAGGRDFLLCHAGLGNFDPKKSLGDYSVDELLWARPTLDDRYFDDVVTVFGHTPTALFDPAHAGEVLFCDTWIDVDVGVASGNSAVLLRLDDLSVITE
ncbi:MAG: metallophosphoesterase [Clostridia bacterium]|nr:metallophosphoesterase [Clostridia bacterium]